MNSGVCWLIGGTSDSAQIARRLSAQAISYVVTVTTPSARKLYLENAQVWVGKLSPPLAEDFVRRYRVCCIADASHPFASEISEGAIALSQTHHIPYLRYERPTISEPATHSSVIWADSINALVDRPLLQHQRILFAIGYRHLPKFARLRQTSQLFARILPSESAIAGTLAAGFSSKEIVALRPPISLALEIALWQQWNISCVVAKASGQLLGDAAGFATTSSAQPAPLQSGEQIKRQAANQLGIQLVLIRRPLVAYPQKTDNVEDIVNFCRISQCSTDKN